jgi:hypothetical protein
MTRKKQKTMSDFVSAKGEQPYDEHKMTKDSLSERLLRVTLAGNISFRAATNPELVSLLSEAWPDIDITNRKELQRTLMKVVKHSKSDLKEKLMTNKSKISIVLDGWKSANKIHFQGDSPDVTGKALQTVFKAHGP